MTTFTFNERECIGWNVRTNDEYIAAVKHASYLVYLYPGGPHRFENMDFPLLIDGNKLIEGCKANRRVTTGPVIFALAPTNNKLPTLLFETIEKYAVEPTPSLIGLTETDLKFFEKDALRDMFSIISRQDPQTLVPFNETILQICQKVEKHRLERLSFANSSEFI